MNIHVTHRVTGWSWIFIIKKQRDSDYILWDNSSSARQFHLESWLLTTILCLAEGLWIFCNWWPLINLCRNLNNEGPLLLLNSFHWLSITMWNIICYLNVKILGNSGGCLSPIMLKNLLILGLYYYFMNPKHLEKNVAAVQEVGISPLRIQFCCSNCCRNVEQVKADLSWGWSEKEWRAAFAKCPWCIIWLYPWIRLQQHWTSL